MSYWLYRNWWEYESCQEYRDCQKYYVKKTTVEYTEILKNIKIFPTVLIFLAVSILSASILSTGSAFFHTRKLRYYEQFQFFFDKFNKFIFSIQSFYLTSLIISILSKVSIFQTVLILSTVAIFLTVSILSTWLTFLTVSRHTLDSLVILSSFGFFVIYWKVLIFVQAWYSRYYWKFGYFWQFRYSWQSRYFRKSWYSWQSRYSWQSIISKISIFLISSILLTVSTFWTVSIFSTVLSFKQISCQIFSENNFQLIIFFTYFVSENQKQSWCIVLTYTRFVFKK